MNHNLCKISLSKRYQICLDNIYLFLFGFLFLDAFYRTTMFPQIFVVNQWIPTLPLLAVIFLKLFFYGREKPFQSALIGVLALSFLAIYKNTRDINLPIMAYLVIGAYGVSFRKIISVYTAIGIPMLLFCIVASQTGLIPDLVFDMSSSLRGFRHSFGFIYPTDFAAHVIYLVLSYSWLRGKKLTWLELAMFAFLGLVINYFCDTRTSFSCLMLFILFLVREKLFSSPNCRVISKTNMLLFSATLKFLSAYSVIFSSLFMIILTVCYSKSAMLSRIDHIVAGRLSMSNLAIKQYGMKLLGQEITMQGNGYSESSLLEKYFFIDCSYIKMLVCYGLVVSILIWIAYTLLGRRAIKANDTYLIWALGIIGLHCAMEHHLAEIAYNPFLLALFSQYCKPIEKGLYNATNSC